MSVSGDIVIGLDDFFTSFEETLTERRRTQLDQARAKVEAVAENMNRLVRFLSIGLESLGDVATLEAARINAFQKVFATRSPAVESGPGAKALEGLKSGASVVKYALTGMKFTAKGVDWAITLSNAVAAPAAKATSEGIEMAVLGAAKAAQASSASGAALVTPVSKYAAWAEKVGVYASAAGMLVKLLDRILDAVNIAAMRNEMARCETLLAEMRGSAKQLEQDVGAYLADHRRIYGLYCAEGQEAFVALSETGEPVSAERFYAGVGAATKLVLADAPQDIETFRTTLDRVSHQGHVLSVALRAAIRESRDQLQAFEAKLDLAWGALRSGASAAELAEAADLPEEILARIVSEAPSDADPSAHRLMIELLPDGDFSITTGPRVG